MLNVYNYEPQGLADYDLLYAEDVVTYLHSNDPSLWDTLCRVEGVERFGNNILSKFNGEPVSVYDVSKGIQILLCIMKYPDKVFSTMECGDNIYDEIYKLNEGNVYMPYGLMPYHFEKELCIITKQGSKVFNNYEEASDFFEAKIC